MSKINNSTELSVEELEKVIAMYDTAIRDTKEEHKSEIEELEAVKQEKESCESEYAQHKFDMKREAVNGVLMGAYTTGCGAIVDLKTAIYAGGMYFVAAVLYILANAEKIFKKAEYENRIGSLKRQERGLSKSLHCIDELEFEQKGYKLMRAAK